MALATDRFCLQFRQFRFYKDRYQYGCSPTDGRDHCWRQQKQHKETDDSLGCAKLVVFCNAPDDNPFMAGAFHGVTEADAIINVGVSGPGVVKHSAWSQFVVQSFEVLCETIKKTAFKVTRVGQLVAQRSIERR